MVSNLRSLVLGALFVVVVLVAACTTEVPSVVENSKGPGEEASTDHSAAAFTEVPESGSVAATQSNVHSSNESFVPYRQETPDLLLVLDTPPPPGHRDPLRNVYGYDLATKQLHLLSSGERRYVHDVTVSPDGRWFAYIRQRGFGSIGDAVCLRSVHGGEPRCHWGPYNLIVGFRPGASELYVSAVEQDRSWKLVRLDLSQEELKAEVLPYGINGSFSPDGSRYMFQEPDGLWLVELGADNPPQKVFDQTGVPYWLNPTRIAVIAGTPHDHDLYLLDLHRSEPVHVGTPHAKYDLLSDVLPDPTGRYLMVIYGIQRSTEAEEYGVGVYDQKSGQWQLLEKKSSRESTHSAFWLGRTTKMVLQVDDRAILYDPATGEQRTWPKLPQWIHGQSPDGDWLLSLHPDRNVLELYHMRTGRVHRVETDGRLIQQVNWVPVP